jgi:hypothetical protein
MKLLLEIIEKEYIKSGRHIAEGEQLRQLLGTPAGLHYEFNKLKYTFLEKQYAKQGYETISLRDFARANFGQDISPALRKKRASTKAPTNFAKQIN